MNTHRKPYQLASTAFMLGNLLFFANKLDEMSRLFLSKWIPDVISGEDILLILIGQGALIIGYIAFLKLYSQRAGRFGKNSLRLLCSGGILLALGHISFMTVPGIPEEVLEPFFMLVLIGNAALLIGLILFGIANLRQPILRCWRWLPLATGSIGFIGFFMFGGENITPIFLLFRTLFALGLIGLGLTVWLENPDHLEDTIDGKRLKLKRKPFPSGGKSNDYI